MAAPARFSLLPNSALSLPYFSLCRKHVQRDCRLLVVLDVHGGIHQRARLVHMHLQQRLQRERIRRLARLHGSVHVCSLRRWVTGVGVSLIVVSLAPRVRTQRALLERTRRVARRVPVRFLWRAPSRQSPPTL